MLVMLRGFMLRGLMLVVLGNLLADLGRRQSLRQPGLLSLPRDHPHGRSLIAVILIRCCSHRRRIRFGRRKTAQRRADY
jgi:hypothetical protein